MRDEAVALKDEAVAAPEVAMAKDPGAARKILAEANQKPTEVACASGPTLVSWEGTAKASDVATVEAVAVATSCDILAEAKKELVAAGAVENPAANDATKVGTDDARVVW